MPRAGISRRCIPCTPSRRPLAELTTALVTTAGLPAIGWPGTIDLQRRVVLDALELLVTPLEPGRIVEKSYEP